jgi:hypothetical protein
VAQASKITPTGTLYTAGTIDEVTYNPASGVKTNLLNNTQQLNASPWVAGGTVALTTATLAPDGTNTAYKFTENSTLGEHIWYQAYSNKNVTVTQSCYFKAAERTQAYLSLSNFVTESCQARFDLSAGTVNTVGGAGPDWTNVSGTIKSAGNGWYRCTLTATKGSVNTNCEPTVATLIPSFNSVYQGDGTSGIYVWGPQLEVGQSATIYVPTGANAVPAPTFASRTDSSGNTYITNQFDEVTYNTTSGVKKNLLWQTQNWTANVQYYSDITITANSIQAPDGTQTGTTLTTTVGGNNNDALIQKWNPTGLLPTALPYCVSVFVKQNNCPTVGLNLAFYNGTTYQDAILTLTWSNLSIATTGSNTGTLNYGVTDAGAGWYRLWCSATNNYSAVGVVGRIWVRSVYNNNIVGDSTYIWGIQIEQGSIPTIYQGIGNTTVLPPTFAQRTELGGNVYVSGNYDEVSQPLSPVVDSSLIMHLDPAMTNSYPGTGTTWYDLSGYGNHATFLTGAYPTGIQQAPGYSTDYGGIIVLNGGQQSVPNAVGNNVWANTSIKTSTFTTTNDRTLSIWVRMHKTTNGLAWMNPITFGVTGTTSSYTYGTGSEPSAPLVSNPVISQNPANYVKTYGTQGIFLGCSFFGDYGLYWYTSIANGQNSLQLGSENRINTPSYQDYSAAYTYNSNPPTINPFYGAWHNIVSTFSYVGNAHVLYIDGVAVNTRTTLPTAIGNYPYTFANLMIGYAGESGGNSVYGYLDADVGQCLIYKRALTTAEVQQNFTTYRARYGI